MGAHEIVIDHRAQGADGDQLHLGHLVRGTEAVEKVLEGNARLQGRRLSDQGEVPRLLHRVPGQHGEAGARAAITSLLSPKIESACAASDLAATWKTVAVSSPAILYMLGIIRSRP